LSSSRLEMDGKTVCRTTDVLSIPTVGDGWTLDSERRTDSLSRYRIGSNWIWVFRLADFIDLRAVGLTLEVSGCGVEDGNVGGSIQRDGGLKLLWLQYKIMGAPRSIRGWTVIVGKFGPMLRTEKAALSSGIIVHVGNVDGVSDALVFLNSPTTMAYQQLRSFTAMQVSNASTRNRIWWRNKVVQPVGDALGCEVINPIRKLTRLCVEKHWRIAYLIGSCSCLDGGGDIVLCWQRR
jgi:hypothetical protein